jgi:uncharacterized RDD family membrane protein YckC
LNIRIIFTHMETINVKTSQHIDIDYPVAGLGERIAARAIDLGLFLVSYFIIFLIGISISSFISRYVMIGLMIFFAVIFVFYNLVTEIFMNGQSIGKRMLKIKVISVDGSQPTIGQYIIRWLFRLVDFWMTGQVLGLIVIAVSENKQRIGDLIAKTTVIKTQINTTIEDIAFHGKPDYTPVFNNTELLSETDIELIHEVLVAYFKTTNKDLIYLTAEKIKTLLGVSIPSDMNEVVFLQTVMDDFNHVTAQDL